MSVTRADLIEFNQFAEAKLSNGGAASLYELLDEWIALCGHEKSVAGIRESVTQYDAGQGLPIDKVFTEIRHKLGRVE